MDSTTTSTRLNATITLLSGSLSRAKALAEAETRIGACSALGLILATETALAELAALHMDALASELVAALPPIAGGAPDFEEIDEAIFSDEWPAYPRPEIDGFVYCDGPTPLSVLADSDPSAEWDVLPSQWDALESRWSDADQLRAFGHV